MNGQHFTGTGLRRHLTQRFRRQMVQRHVVLHLRQTLCRHVGATVSDAAHHHFDVKDLPHQQIDPRSEAVHAPAGSGITGKQDRAIRRIEAVGERNRPLLPQLRFQAVLAKTLKARYLAPYYGRLLENRQNADKIVDDMRAICQPETRILLASLRSAAQVASLAARGHDTFTLAPAVLDDLLTNETSEAATAAFEEAAQRLRG